MNIAKWIQQVLREIFAIKEGKPTTKHIKDIPCPNLPLFEMPKIPPCKGMLRFKKRYWYAVNLNSHERMRIRKHIENDPTLCGIVVLKSVKRCPIGKAKKLKKAA